MALISTLVAGLFFLVGALLAVFGKKKKGLIDFSIGLAFSVMVLLLTFDIVPEVTELYGEKKIFMYIFILIGIIILKLVDLLVPHHDHESEIKTHERHLKHIGIISSLALIVHNIMEGIGIYNIALLDARAGMLMAIAVGLHNIPFGIEITATLSETKKSKASTIINILVLTLSTVIGALIMMVFKSINDFVLASLMSLTIGMIIYLILFELLVEIGSSKNRKFSTFGIVLGIIFMSVILIIGG